MSDLRERLLKTKLFQWSAAYLAASWVLLQVTSLIGEQFNWPPALLRGITILLGVGLLITLTLSWYHGERGRQRVTGVELVLLAGLLLLAGVGVKLVARGKSPAPQSAAAAPLAARKAIAVLPFANLSDDKSNEYFSDGITEELINALARIEGLAVVARTSAAAFKGKGTDMREIGRQLGATTLLEGSVRKSGRQLRIQARLVDATNGYQLWSQVYERELEDVFAIQQDIAAAIVQNLQIDLGAPGAKASAAPGTTDLQAWDLYLQGRYLWNRRVPGYANEAIRLFTQAVERDSTFASAYAGIADAYIALVVWAGARPADVMPKAKAAVQRALALDSANANAYTSLGYLSYWYDWNYEKAEAEFRQSIALDPAYSTAHHWYSLLLINLGRGNEGLQEIQLAQRLEPLSPIINTIVGAIQFYRRDYDAAIAAGRITANGEPTFAINHFQLGRSYAMTNRLPEAVSQQERALELSDRNPIVLAALGHAYAVSGDSTRALAIADSLERRARAEPVSPYWVAALYTGLGKSARALDWLERGYQERDGWLVNVGVDPFFDVLDRNPRYQQLLQRLRLRTHR